MTTPDERRREEWETIVLQVKKDPSMNGMPSGVISYKGDLYYKKQERDPSGLVEALEKMQTISAHMQSKRSFDLNKIASEALAEYRGTKEGEG